MGKDCEDIRDALEADPATSGKCDVSIEIDTVENMTGKGQYVYAYVSSLGDPLPADAEPQFKFNDGHYGGSHNVLKQEHAALANGNVFAGSGLAAIKPTILELLAQSAPAK